MTSQREIKPWIPSSLEQKCLDQLDRPENWRLLHREQPPFDEVLNWSPFALIFRFNLLVFGIAIGLMVIVVSKVSGTEIREMVSPGNLVPGLLFVAIAALLMATFATSLYRRSRNRRARYLLATQDNES